MTKLMKHLNPQICSKYWYIKCCAEQKNAHV